MKYLEEKTRIARKEKKKPPPGFSIFTVNPLFLTVCDNNKKVQPISGIRGGSTSVTDGGQRISWCPI